MNNASWGSTYGNRMNQFRSMYTQGFNGQRRHTLKLDSILDTHTSSDIQLANLFRLSSDTKDIELTIAFIQAIENMDTSTTLNLLTSNPHLAQVHGQVR